MNPRIIFEALVLLTLILVSSFLVTCMETDQEVIVGEDVIGPGGGIVVGEDGIILEIPPGALDKDTLITARLIEESELPIPPPEGFSLMVGFELQPDGIEFNIPVLITVPINGSFPAGKPFPLHIFDPVDNVYRFTSEAFVSPDGNSLSAQISHFSLFPIFDLIVHINDINNQRRLKQTMIDRISREVINRFEDQEFCFHDEGLLSFGDIGKVIERLDEIDVIVDGLVGNLVLNRLNNPAALYYPCSAGAIILGIVDDLLSLGLNSLPPPFCDDILLPDEPDSDKVEASTLLHEMMHAIFDEHRDELVENGFRDENDEEAITMYFENAVRIIITPDLDRQQCNLITSCEVLVKVVYGKEKGSNLLFTSLINSPIVIQNVSSTSDSVSRCNLSRDVMNRGIARQKMFIETADYEDFVKTIAETHELRGMEVTEQRDGLVTG